MNASRSLEQANSLMREGRYAEAVNAFRFAAEEFPDISSSGLSECFFYLKDYDAAMVCANQLLGVEKFRGRCHHLRGLIYEKKGELNLARGEYELGMRYGEEASTNRLHRLGAKS